MCLISGEEQGLGVEDWSRLRLSASGVPLVSLSADDGGRCDTFGAGGVTTVLPQQRIADREGKRKKRVAQSAKTSLSRQAVLVVSHRW